MKPYSDKEKNKPNEKQDGNPSKKKLFEKFSKAKNSLINDFKDTKPGKGVVNDINQFKPENYKGEIKFDNDPKYYNFFVSDDCSKVILASSNLNSNKNGQFKIEYISASDDPKFFAIIDLFKSKNQSESESMDYKTFFHEKTNIKLKYRFLKHTGFKRRSIELMMKKINPHNSIEEKQDNKYGKITNIVANEFSNPKNSKKESSSKSSLEQKKTKDAKSKMYKKNSL